MAEVRGPTAIMKIVLGTMIVGEEGARNSTYVSKRVAHANEYSSVANPKGAKQARISTVAEVAELLNTFAKHGHKEVDTARVYGVGTTEGFLGQLDMNKRGLIVDTKLSRSSKIGLPDGEPTTHRPEHLRQGLAVSLKELRADKVDMFYLHAPDRSTPYEDTLRELNNLYNEGKFNRLGISNYMASRTTQGNPKAWEVAQMVEICERNGWVKPSVYQGIYHAFHRSAEPELFPCLRKYGLSFYQFNPLAGGFISDRLQRGQTDFEASSRFHPDHKVQVYRERYWKDEYFDALEILRAAVKKHGMGEAEAALRWAVHHSALSEEHGDAIIVGASSAKQLEENLTNLEKGPLPDDVVAAFDEGWQKVKGVCVTYFR
ncbi:Aflatoxin B1 aldehyde reductase member [Drechslerella dactyloides]|uniref:Aflatoxin B1 aldehyde reductase member n=1 Tax=Drechslerella dactyloides TaxID=74499 RepID=A0AAD6NMF1_DREDA|nr:Aflatoxin B1 aldehyde reductase member [Drechslerella dactyloides]